MQITLILTLQPVFIRHWDLTKYYVITRNGLFYHSWGPRPGGWLDLGENPKQLVLSTDVDKLTARRDRLNALYKSSTVDIRELTEEEQRTAIMSRLAI